MKTIEMLSVEYINHITSLRYSQWTVKAYRGFLRRFTAWMKETVQVEDVHRLESVHLKKWHGFLLSARTLKGHPYKVNHINLQITSVRNLIQYMADNGYVRHELVKMLPHVKTPVRLPGSVLSHAHMRKFLSKISTDTKEGYRNRAMVELLYSSGIRRSELLGLNIGDIDFSNHIAMVIGKGNKQRVVPVGKTALRFLETYLKAVRPYFLKNRDEQALFLSNTGKRLSLSMFNYVIRALRDQAGLDDDITSHTFRRSCTTELIRSGANMYHVKELLGHESLDTLKHYAKLTIVDLKKTHEKCHPRERDDN